MRPLPHPQPSFLPEQRAQATYDRDRQPHAFAEWTAAKEGGVSRPMVGVRFVLGRAMAQGGQGGGYAH